MSPVQIAICFIILLGAGALIHPHAPLTLGTTFGFSAWFGFASCAALVIVAKFLFGGLFKRPEDYYDQ
jgi:hypothetical protein